MSSLDIALQQGKTFSRVFRWGTEPLVFKPITGITQAGQAVLTAVGHGLPAEWVGAVSNVDGMTQINALNEPARASDYERMVTLTVDTIQLPNVNSADFDAYVANGYVRYYTPVDLSGFTARMKIKSRPGGTEYVSLVSPTDIVIDNTAKTITVTIAATVTAALAFNSAVYELEMAGAGGVVTQLATGNVSLEMEIAA